MKVQFPAKDALALGVITLLSVLANLPEGWGNWLVSRNTLLAALIAVIIIALFHYLEALLLMSITTLAIGANLPRELAADLGVSQGIMLAALAAIIGVTLLNRVLGLVPLNAAEHDEVDPEQTLMLDLSAARLRMMDAISHGQIGTIRKLIARDRNVNFVVDGNTPLHLAAEKGYSAIVQLLIDSGADLLAQNDEGNTPLDIALTLRKYAQTTDILYKATIPLLAPRGA
jgi:hypothetical protein